MQSFELSMPQKYREHYLYNQVFGIFRFFFAPLHVKANPFLSLQLKSLMYEDIFKDVTVRLGSVRNFCLPKYFDKMYFFFVEMHFFFYI